MTLIVIALLAVAGGLAVAAGSRLHWTAEHQQDLLTLVERAPDRLRVRWLAALATRLRPSWLFAMSTALGLAVIASDGSDVGGLRGWGLTGWEGGTALVRRARLR